MAPPPAAPQGPPKIEGPGGTIRIGLLAQAQYQALGSNTLDGNDQNLYLRRIRFFIGGNVLKDFEYFFLTDFPNLFLAPNSAMSPLVKNNPGMNVQDLMITYRVMGEKLKIDAGYMLPPLAHNSLQSAASLLSWDYYVYTFTSGAAFGNAFGRDTGVQVRGLVLDNRFEYRLAMFNGVRRGESGTNVGGRNFFRVTGRVQVNLLDPETGFFYGGTYLGAKRILSVGAAFDFQDGGANTGPSYKYWAADAIADMPVGPAGVLSAQVNYAQWNTSNGTFVDVPKQSALMADAGFIFTALQFSPILRFEKRFVPNGGTMGLPNETRYAGGVAFWPFGHTSNLKAFYTRIHDEATGVTAFHDFNQVNIQWQLFFY